MNTQPAGDVSRLRWQPTVASATELISRKHLWRVLPLLTATLFLLAGVWIHNQVEDALHRIIAEHLQTILETDIAAIEFWMEQERSNVISWSEEENLRSLTQALQTLAVSTSTPGRDLPMAAEQARLRELLEPLIDTDNYLGFAIINSSGLVLATSANDTRIIGQRLSVQGQAELAGIFTGRVSWIPPFWKGEYLDSESVQQDRTLMGVAAPIAGDDKFPQASLLFFIPPEKDFTRILSIARMGETGNTYAFNADIRMLSDSRDLESLKTAGIIPDTPTSRAVLRVELRDPGGNLLKGYRTSTPMAGRPLTRLIAAARSDDSQHHVIMEAYRDYRGVPVVGAARWLPQLGFGIATEVDAAEAFSALRPIEMAFWTFSALLLLALAGLAASGVLVRRMGNRIEAIKQLGQYTLEEKIGEGGMGKVYKARHALLRRPTAVKLISSTTVDSENLARFEHEVQLTSQLTHPNTIEIYDYGHTREGVFYYVMEYLPGIDLSRLIEEDGAIPANRAAHILCQVCGSLSEAHARGLIHRDIKPLNIILTERGGQLDVAKVLDFGLVKDLNTGIERTVADAIPGTPPYIAPEILSDPSNIDCRSDLYSVGALAFNLLTGKPVFEGSSSMDIAYKVVAEVAPRVSQFVSVDKELDQLVSDCLERQPEARPQTAQAIIDRLQTIIGQDKWTQTDARNWWQQHPQWLGNNASEK